MFDFALVEIATIARSHAINSALNGGCSRSRRYQPFLQKIGELP